MLIKQPPRSSIQHSRNIFVGLVIAAQRGMRHWNSAPLERSLALVRRTIIVLLLAAMATVNAAYDLAQAQEPPTELTKLSLEELMGTDVVSLNVLGTHIHTAGQFMFGFEYMNMQMRRNLDGTRKVSDSELLGKYFTAPTDMVTENFMGMVMYAPTDDLTLMASLPYITKSMNHVTRDGVRFPENSEGLGDLQVNALYTLYSIRRYQHRLILNAGISFPTGSIDKQDFGPDPSMGKARLEYPMQLGSGTYDILPGLTYLGQATNWAWGAEVIPTVRLGRNKHSYRLGDHYRMSTWGARKLTEWLSLSARFDALIWENIHGADPALDRTDEPTKDPSVQGGRRVDFLPGINFYVPRGFFKGNRLAVEFGVPIYQSLNGPQLATDWFIRIGYQWVF